MPNNVVARAQLKGPRINIDWIRDPPPPLGEILNKQIAQQVIKELDRRIGYLNDVNAALRVQRREVEQKLNKM
jgi:hypothetical protein